MRIAVAAFALLALAACGQQKAAAPAEGAPPAAAQAGDADSVLLGSTQNMPDWLLVARQSSGCTAEERAEGENCGLGDIHFNQRTITRQADGTADIWVQVRYPRAQLYEYETETSTTTIRYELERLHYRFNCQTEQFVVIERQIMGPNETVAAEDRPIQIYRAPVQGSVTKIVMPIACRGS